MINETEQQHDVESEYFDKIQPDKEQNGNHIDSYDDKIQPQTSIERLKAQPIDGACTQASLTIGPPKSLIMFDAEDRLVHISTVDGPLQWYIQTKLRTRILHVYQ